MTDRPSFYCGEFNRSIHSAGAASRLAALLIVRIFPICSHFAPGHPGAAPPSVYTYIELRTLARKIQEIRSLYWMQVTFRSEFRLHDATRRHLGSATMVGQGSILLVC